MTMLPLRDLENAADDPQAAARIRAALGVFPDLVTALSLAENFIAECECSALLASKPGTLTIIRKALARAESEEIEGGTAP